MLTILKRRRGESKYTVTVSQRAVTIAVLTPTVCPFMRAKQQMMFLAYVGMISKTERDRAGQIKGRKGKTE